MKKEELKQEVERVVGHELREARDFETLSHLILKGTRERLSPTTLKRLWGYLKNEEVQTRQHTLDVLARFAGYRCYEDFCAHPDNKDDVQSGICIEDRVTTEGMRLEKPVCCSQVFVLFMGVVIFGRFLPVPSTDSACFQF